MQEAAAPYDFDKPRPDIFAKFDGMVSGQVATRTHSPRSEVHMQPGAGLYEPRFRKYWLVTAWAFFGYQSLVMLVLLASMLFTKVEVYSLVIHILGTLVFTFGTAAMACIYRFVLFPTPFYYSNVIEPIVPPRLNNDAQHGDTV